MPTCGMIKLPSAILIISSLTPLFSLPNTRATDSVRFSSYNPTASALKCVVYIFEKLERSALKHAAAFVYWCTVSHLAALEDAFSHHISCSPIFVLRMYISCTPTASHVRITADILWGSLTFSNTIVSPGCRFASTLFNRSVLSGVMLRK